jgi:hypothetical protein
MFWTFKLSLDVKYIGIFGLAYVWSLDYFFLKLGKLFPNFWSP